MALTLLAKISIFTLLTCLISESKQASSLCNSKIYCNGTLLHTVQMSSIFKDSKTFVDMPTKVSEAVVLENFASLSNASDPAQLRKFLNENFHESGYDIVTVEPVDWTDNPNYVNQINDTRLKELALFLNLKWKHLLRKFDRSRICDDCSTSALPTSNPFIVPGGRFIEFYYWDTYWIVKGLLVNGMVQTARGILENFLNIVDSLGFVPNGSRVYYLNRSQPPLLTHMVSVYLRHTNDVAFLRDKVHLLDKEYAFWMREKTVNYSKPNDLSQYSFNVYSVHGQAPRPESYKEDYTKAHEAKSKSGQESFYSNVMTAAESGNFK
jgi:alpha,alpha-trehalase